ncbi:MAG TPA: hypothetical protein PK957_01895 [Candidatus Dojkabacteria bacterium]|nr:hypothetical protein [Candidatus Dojkabacteria bacterium]HQF36879.1 hypothetical protein [Candidatus Dojkabacteria bacterium]
MVWFAIGFLPATSTDKIVENVPEEDVPTTAENTHCHYCGSDLPSEILELRKDWGENPKAITRSRVKSHGSYPYCQAPVVVDDGWYYISSSKINLTIYIHLFNLDKVLTVYIDLNRCL